MKYRLFTISVILLSVYTVKAQAPQSWSSGQIQQAIKKLKVLGSVLYIAAHPDDENTRLITYLANEKLYRTGYLSLTRGDGGQNLIGDEQGVELGLIRTQELLAARRIDGGEQFFSSAYDFGYSKTPEETFAKWNKQKILGDVVWVIRNFRPDVIITRFPTTGEGGHGHHTASAILANEAFKAAADPLQFPEQLKPASPAGRYVKPWQAKRIFWNTFNFGGNNTTASTQYQVNVGGYNPLLGRSYGEIAAESRSQHKSQGFGAAASRGESIEFFKTTGGDAPEIDLLDGVNTGWERVGREGAGIRKIIDDIEKRFEPEHPERSVRLLANLYNAIDKIPDDYWKEKKKKEVQQLIAACSGLYIDAFSNQPYAVQTGEMNITITVNSRLPVKTTVKEISIDNMDTTVNAMLQPDKNFNFSKTIPVPLSKPVTQPYWLENPKEEGSFNISDQKLVGKPDVEPAFIAKLLIQVEGNDLVIEKPVRYKFTDPVKGEQYQPLYVVPQATLTVAPNLLLFKNGSATTRQLQVQLHANKTIDGNLYTGLTGIDYSGVQNGTTIIETGTTKTYTFQVTDKHAPEEEFTVSAYANKKTNADTTGYYLALRAIDYDHIPAIRYFYPDFVKVVNIDLKTAGKKIGYIPGAGDKEVNILSGMGYEVTILDRQALAATDLKIFDAIITGVRAYNTNEWMPEVYDRLMNYVKEGGNLIVQYNTNNNIGRVKSKIGPYDFEIGRNRITDENAKVTLLDPAHKVFNFPNKITQKDFTGWIQERSIYHAANRDAHYTPLLSMADPGEAADNGSLIVTKYGKGYFTYTGLVFFRQLPAAVPGALRLMANLIGMNSPGF